MDNVFNEIVTIEQAKNMIGEIVSAIGTCGLGDGETVNGILTQVSPCIVMVLKGKGGSQPYSVDKNTLKTLKTLP